MPKFSHRQTRDMNSRPDPKTGATTQPSEHRAAERIPSTTWDDNAAPVTEGPTLRELTDAGFVLLPVPLRKKAPVVEGGWKAYQHQATRPTAEQYRAWFGPRYHGNAWMACGGVSQVFVLDIDSEAADRFWRDVMGLGPAMDATVSVQTAKGHHYWFWVPADSTAKGWSYHSATNPVSFDVRGQGTGVVIPPSIHETGVVYRWVNPPKLDQERFGMLPCPPEVLTDRAARHKLDGKTGSDDRHPQAQSLADLLANPPAEGGRNDWLAKVAGHYARTEHRRAGEAGFDDYARQVAQQNARCTPPLANDELAKVTRSIWAEQLANHPDDGGAGNGRISALDITSYVYANYDSYRTPEGEPFVVARRGVRRPVMLAMTGGELQATLMADFADRGQVLPTTALQQALSILFSKGMRAQTQTLSLRACQQPGRIVVDLGEPDTTRCVWIAAEGWELHDAPPEGVVFGLGSNQALPVPSRDSNLDRLRELMTWAEADPRWRLVRGWLVASLFGNIERPMPMFLGQHGSGKSTRGWLAASVIDPRGPELGGELLGDRRDEMVSSLSQYVVAYDNISRVDQRTADRICTLVTGRNNKDRLLYTNKGASTTSFKRTGVVTAITEPGFPPDALERMIPIECDRIDKTQRVGGTNIKQGFTDAHPAILGGVFDLAVVALANWDTVRALPPEQHPRPRFGDYYDAIYAYSPEDAEAFATSTETTAREAAEDDPFIAAVAKWLAWKADRGELPCRVGVAEAWKQAESHQERIIGHEPWWPKSQAEFGKAIRRSGDGLLLLGYRVAPGKRNGHGATLMIAPEGYWEQPELAS